SRSDGSYKEKLDDCSWPGAEAQVGAPNGRTWLETCRSDLKLDSGLREAAFTWCQQPANVNFHFLQMAVKGTNRAFVFHHSIGTR
ncbi:MAG: hypothetical protein ABTQ26_08430, partial [Azonexus sp.]